MTEFLKLSTVDQVLKSLDSVVKTTVKTETVNTLAALGRIIAKEIAASEDLPAFLRSTMDGYALRASDTYGASEGQPAYLNIVGEVLMGQPAKLIVKKGEVVKLHTGAMLPDGADAVVILENTQQTGTTLEVVKSVAPGENIIRVGDDVRVGSRVLTAGTLLRPQDIGGLMALGKTQIEIYNQPKVCIISSGDEIVSPQNTPGPGQVRDVNTYSLSCLISQCGGISKPLGIVPDNYDELSKAAKQGFKEGDILLISAGSSISTRDITAKVISSLGKPEMMVHGLSIKPGKPTIVAVIGGKPVFGLPGNPVSAMIVFDLLVRPVIFKVGGCIAPPLLSTVLARVTQNIPSTPGREDFIPVEIKVEGNGYAATPIFGESNLISTMMKAGGIVRIPLAKHGLMEGETVIVRLFQ